MLNRHRRTLITAAVAASVLAAPAASQASSSMLIGMADEAVLEGQRFGRSGDAFAKDWKASGVQDVRTYAQWNEFAPNPQTTSKPSSNLSDPATYNFTELDARLKRISDAGMTPTLVITGPGPYWASASPRKKLGTWKPNATMFGQFATAVAKHVADRVERYIIWNEPNVSTWLMPQNSCKANKCTNVSAGMYRNLARAGYSAVKRNDSSSVVGIGTTSSKGDEIPASPGSTTQPLVFLRRLACVNNRYKTVRDGDCKSFKPATGNALAYHPHSRQFSPGDKSPSMGDARMGDISRLTTVIDKLSAKRRLKVSGASKFPLWFDEYAYETNPPDDTMGVSTAKQAAWSQWGWWTAYKNSRVKMLTQYEWVDEPLGENGFGRWQSGLYFNDGTAKPMAAAFANPIFGWRKGSTAGIWGQVRPGDQAVQVTLERASGSSWTTVKTMNTDRYGNFKTSVPKSTSAKYRYRYVDPLTSVEKVSLTTKLQAL